MSREKMRRHLLYFMIFVSFFSLFLITAIAFFAPEIQDNFQWRKQSSGVFFIFVCISGIISVFLPRQCSKLFHETAKTVNSNASVREKRSFQKSSKILGVVLTHGHHPECRGFYHHEIKVGNKTYCVACMGLFFGAVMAVFGAFSYFFLERFVGIDALVLVVFGIIGVALCLLQYVFFDVHSRLIRFSLNAFFIFGMFLILAGIDFIVQSLTLNVFLIVFFIFWVFTRILLSKDNHGKICHVCNLDCDVKKG